MVATLTGCATNTFNYKPSSPGITVSKGVTVQVDEFRNNLGFADPTRIRFNVVLDRPASQAIREAMVAELRQAGYQIGPSPTRVSGSIDDFGVEGRPVRAAFEITKEPSGQTLFSRSYSTPSQRSSIYDEEGNLRAIQALVLQFIRDREAQQIFTSGGLPPVQQVQAPPIPDSAVPPPPSDVDRVPVRSGASKTNAYAIVIGIEQYREKLPKADFADRDAKLVGEYLTKVMGHPEENVIVRTNDKASMNDVVKYLESWLPNNVEKDSSVFIYYSGHGAPNTKTGDAYLVPYDGDPTFVEKTGYPLKKLYAQLESLPTKDITVVLDSCFSGAGGRSVIGKGLRPMGLSMEHSISAAGKAVVLAASSGDQVSSTYEEKGHGLLTYFFLKGLQGAGDLNKDGNIDMAELYEYVKPNVSKVARKQYNN
ncbi:MAG: peptidase C14 [Nitrospiraceae bacterium]|nr:peptidase C14 [Nitrospiraceae bacterium]